MNSVPSPEARSKTDRLQDAQCRLVALAEMLDHDHDLDVEPAQAFSNQGLQRILKDCSEDMEAGIYGKEQHEDGSAA